MCKGAALVGAAGSLNDLRRPAHNGPSLWSKSWSAGGGAENLEPAGAGADRLAQRTSGISGCSRPRPGRSDESEGFRHWFIAQEWGLLRGGVTSGAVGQIEGQVNQQNPGLKLAG